MFTVIVSPVTDAIGKAVPAAGSVALGYVLVTLLPSVSQVNDNEFVDIVALSLVVKLCEPILITLRPVSGSYVAFVTSL